VIKWSGISWFDCSLNDELEELEKLKLNEGVINVVVYTKNKSPQSSLMNV
jgi:hypothetical protein